jgi:hypothetical protein
MIDVKYIFIFGILLLSLASLTFDGDVSHASFDVQQSNASLKNALTFHVSFDQGGNADFGSGDKKIYSGEFKGSADQTGVVSVPGLGSPALSITSQKGRFGGALEFTKEKTHSVFYNLEKNIQYQNNAFNGSVSFWMSLDPNEIPVQYCDPIQLTDKYYASDAIWADITKNDIPPDFRVGVYGDQAAWDPKNKAGAAEEFFWRILKISEPPFKKNEWTHVIITWENLNTGNVGRAKLFLNGEYRGQSGPIKEPFKWDPSKVTMRLGIGKFVGLMDDIALFNKALTKEEVQRLNKLKNGVNELYK